MIWHIRSDLEYRSYNYRTFRIRCTHLFPSAFFIALPLKYYFPSTFPLLYFNKYWWRYCFICLLLGVVKLHIYTHRHNLNSVQVLTWPIDPRRLQNIFPSHLWGQESCSSRHDNNRVVSFEIFYNARENLFYRDIFANCWTFLIKKQKTLLTTYDGRLKKSIYSYKDGRLSSTIRSGQPTHIRETLSIVWNMILLDHYHIFTLSTRQGGIVRHYDSVLI